MATLRATSISNTIFAKAGIAIGFAVLLTMFALATQQAQAQTYTVLYAFEGNPDGAVPAAGVIRDEKGNLYGTTSGGGDHVCKNTFTNACGTVFKIDPEGKETVLYSFSRERGTNPGASLVRDSDGNLFGTASAGGRFGGGAAFKLSADGDETVLHNFTQRSGGFDPLARLVRDSSGNLYGTTFQGGNSTDLGVVFELDKLGKETVLHTFDKKFGNASAGVLRDSSGTLYGTAGGGKTTPQCMDYPCGVVYRLSKTGIGEIFYKFTGGPDGMWPGYGDLITDEAGNLYGATPYGGGTGCSELQIGCGIVFKIDPKGVETVLYRFTGGMDGGFPWGGLARDSQGNLYGTTNIGGNVDLPACYNEISGNGCGVVFKLDSSGHETTLYAFTGAADGGGPNSDLIRDAAGNLYGTTVYGGNVDSLICPIGCGVVFKITP